jgi:predicted nucleotidyltransferase
MLVHQVVQVEVAVQQLAQQVLVVLELPAKEIQEEIVLHHILQEAMKVVQAVEEQALLVHQMQHREQELLVVPE